MIYFSTIKRNVISGDAVTVLVHNVRSLLRHVNNIVSGSRNMDNDIVGVTQTQIKPSDSTCKITETLNFFNINFNNNKNKFLSLAYGWGNDVAFLNKFDAKGVSILYNLQETCFCQQSIHFNVSL